MRNPKCSTKMRSKIQPCRQRKKHLRTDPKWPPPLNRAKCPGDLWCVPRDVSEHRSAAACVVTSCTCTFCVCLSACLSVCLAVWLSVCRSVCLSVTTSSPAARLSVLTTNTTYVNPYIVFWRRIPTVSLSLHSQGRNTHSQTWRIPPTSLWGAPKLERTEMLKL